MDTRPFFLGRVGPGNEASAAQLRKERTNTKEMNQYKEMIAPKWMLKILILDKYFVALHHITSAGKNV